MFNFDTKIDSLPFPAYYSSNVFEKKFYDNLCNEFPKIGKNTLANVTFQGNRHRLQKGSKEYENFINNNLTWNSLNNYLLSSNFEIFVNSIFKKNTIREINKNNIRTFNIKNKIKTWIKYSKSLSLDISNAGLNYVNAPHYDRLHRKFVILLFFSDHNEEGMEGGSFKFHKLKNRKYQNDRFIDINNCEEIASFKPKHNSGIIFMNSVNSIHSVDFIKKINGIRKFAYIAINYY